MFTKFGSNLTYSEGESNSLIHNQEFLYKEIEEISLQQQILFLLFSKLFCDQKNQSYHTQRL